MAAPAETDGVTAGAYRALEVRNRFIAALRILVPLFGLLIFAVLGVQMVIAQMAREFTIGRISFERNRLQVETPSYTGLLADGSAYDITAASAETALENPSIVQLTDASVLLKRGTGVDVTARARRADIEAEKQLVVVPGESVIVQSDGLKATIEGLNADVPDQQVTGGKVHLDYTNGSTLDAESMSYDAETQQWTFTGVTLVMPVVPGPADQ